MRCRIAPVFGAFLFGCLLAQHALAKGPIRFCASFEDKDHYRLLLVDTPKPIAGEAPDSSRTPDSVYCETPFWAHSLWPSFEGDKRSNFERINYDLGDPKELERQCRAKILGADSSIRKVASPRLEWDFDAIDASLYKRESAEKFVRRFYGKTFTGYWMADLACTCPHFETAHQSRTFTAKLVGKCKPGFKKEKRVLPPDYEPPKDTAKKDEENKKPVRIENPDWIPCYSTDYTNGGCKIGNYASKTLLYVRGKTAGIEESLECYKIDGKYYLNFGTNVPQIYYGNKVNFWSCYTDSTRCSLSSSSPALTTQFFSCKEFDLKDGGCKTEYHGLDFVVDENFHIESWIRSGMLYFFKQKEENTLDDFLNSMFHRLESPEQKYRLILPAGVTEKDIMRMGDEAAQKAPGMTFYDGVKKIRYEEFKKPKFKSLKEAMRHCRE